jgi:hypothetical protein
MTHKRIIITGIVFLVLAGAGTALAASNPPACSLNKADIKKLDAIQGATAIDYTGRIRAELAIRKGLLSTTLDCTIKEAKILESNINGISINDPDVQRLQQRVITQAANAVSYYESQKPGVNDLGLQGSRDFAANLKSWREGNYQPLVKQGQNLVVWSHDQTLMQTAQNRMNQVNHAMGLLSIIDNEDMQTPWKDAQGNFKNALDLNQRATMSLKLIDDPDISLNLMKSSLEALSKTYQNFFDLSEALKKVVPH